MGYRLKGGSRTRKQVGGGTAVGFQHAGRQQIPPIAPPRCTFVGRPRDPGCLREGAKSYAKPVPPKCRGPSTPV